jgi:Holliday junction resolvasome RuvABC endonuclease subunit
MSVFGVDISTTKIAIAKLSKGDYSVIEFRSKSRSWETRLEQLYKDFFPYVAENVVTEDTVFIEDVPYVQNRQAVIRLVHVQAMVRVVCIHHNIDIFGVNVSTWKKDVIGDGRADKDKIRKMALKIFDNKLSRFSQDSVDALCIAKWGDLRIGNNI